MEHLVILKNNEVVCSSLDVAEKFGKQHSKVIRSVENLLNNEAKNGLVKKMFIRTVYKDSKGESRQCIL